MTRDTAWRILNTHIKNQVLLSHSLATEAVMRSLAAKLNADQETWALTGLLHDADYEKAKGHPQKHGMMISELEPNTIPSIIEHAIQSHNFRETGVAPINNLDWAMVCCDELTGLIVQMTHTSSNKKLSDLTPEYIIEKLKDKNFAKGAKRDYIYLCEEKLKILLEEFVAITLKAMQKAEV